METAVTETVGNKPDDSKSLVPKESKFAPILNCNISRMMMGLSSIGNLDNEDFKMNYSITKMISKLDALEKAYQKSKTALQKKYCKLDTKGNLMLAEANQVIFKDDSAKAEYIQEQLILDESEISSDITIFRLKASELAKIKGGVKGSVMANCYELIIDDLG